MYRTDSRRVSVSALKVNHTTRLSDRTVNAAWDRGPRYSSVLVCIMVSARFWYAPGAG